MAGVVAAAVVAAAAEAEAAAAEAVAAVDVAAEIRSSWSSYPEYIKTISLRSFLSWAAALRAYGYTCDVFLHVRTRKSGGNHLWIAQCAPNLEAMDIFGKWT